MEAKISFLIVNKNLEVGNRLNKNFKLILDKKNFAFFVNKKLYKPSTKKFFDSVNKYENMFRTFYTLNININRFRKI